MSSPYTPIPQETNVGEVTAWIPLTTDFSWSSACTGQFRLDGPSLMAFDPGYGLEVDTNVICQAPAVTSGFLLSNCSIRSSSLLSWSYSVKHVIVSGWWEQAKLGVATKEGHTAASLQPMVCPVDFSTLASSVKDLSSTLGLCCPPGYYLGGGDVGQAVGNCLSDVLPGMTLTYASTSGTASLSWVTAITTLTAKSTVGAIGVLGWNVDEVVESFPSSPRPAITSLIPAASSTSSPITDPSVIYSGRLSAGAKTAIGFGIALGVIGFLTLLVSMLFVGRRNKKKTNEATVSRPGSSSPSNELQTKEKARELAGKSEALELETIYRYR
ncbi:hypothetical protein V8E51_010202 [Hyaloscypha variabilis]